MSTRMPGHLSLAIFLIMTGITSQTLMVTSWTSWNNKQNKSKWVNPCGIELDRNQVTHSFHKTRLLSEQELLENIALAARKALSHSQDFKRIFVRRTFKSGWKEHLQRWGDQRYNWLTSCLPVRAVHLGRALPAIYNNLLTFGAGLQIIVTEQVVHSGSFITEFNEAEYRLRVLLCELQLAMLERKIEFVDKINEISYQDNYYRDLRHWYIYWSYMKCLEYSIQVLTVLKEKPVSFHPPPSSRATAVIKHTSRYWLLLHKILIIFSCIQQLM